MVLEVLSHGVRLNASCILVELHELTSLDEAVLINIVLLEHVDDPLILRGRLLARATLYEGRAGIWCHLAILVRVEVKPLVEDLDKLIDHLVVRSYQWYDSYFLLDINFERSELLISGEAQLAKGAAVLCVLDGLAVSAL